MSTSQLSKTFHNVAARIAANLPEPVARAITHGDHRVASWYAANGYFKFPIEARLDYKMPSVVGMGDYGPTPYGWQVHAHTQTGDGRDAYRVETECGALRTYPKWNIENHFQRRVTPAHSGQAPSP